MIFHRHWLALCLIGGCWGAPALAQEAAPEAEAAPSGSSKSGTKSGTSSTPEETTGAGETPGGSSSTKPGSGEPKEPATPPPPPPKPVVPAAVPSAVLTTPGASSAFDVSTGTGTGPVPTDAPGGPTGESSAFGEGTGTGGTPQEAPADYTIPGFFGQPSSNFIGGSGRLARPRFLFKATLSQGYDNNIFQTPSDQQRAPDQTILIDPGSPAVTTFVPVTTTTFEQAFAGPIIFFRPVTRTTIQTVTTPARDPVFQTIRSPEPEGRQGSFISRAAVSFDTQIATRRSLFTSDLNLQADRYWDRPSPADKNDYSGSLAVNYLYNLTRRVQITAAANVAYFTQPDLTRINTPDRLGGSDVVNLLGRLNVAYRMTPRFRFTVSAGQNAVLYLNDGNTTTGNSGIGRNGDSFETTLGTELSFLWKPRLTLLGEFRHVLIAYPDTPVIDASSNIFLIGAEFKVSPRLTGTLRLGEAIRTFDESGETATSPYAEGTLNYRINPTTAIQAAFRYGFEEPLNAGSEVLTYRTSVSLVKNFTPRLSLALTGTGIFRTTSATGGGQEFSEQAFDVGFTLEYHVTRQFTLNANYSFTASLSSEGFNDYDRSRIFIGGEYAF